MKNFIIIFTIAMLISCADTTELVKGGNDAFKLHPENSIFVSVPSDGSYGGRVYAGSGRNLSQIVYSSFSKYSQNIQAGNQVQTYEEAITFSKMKHYQFLIMPSILAWEDRATEWSGRPDQVSVKIAIIHVDSGTTMGSVIINGKSGMATLGGDHPQDLLPEPIGEYAESMFRS